MQLNALPALPFNTMRVWSFSITAYFLLAVSLTSEAKSRSKEEPIVDPKNLAGKNVPIPEDGKTNSRDGKLFSLFSIVNFQNSGCRSQSTFGSSTASGSSSRNGTCFTSQECSAKGGAASGNCASGFGVCCIFLVSTSGSSISQNCTYIRNPGFPKAYTGGTNAATYTLNKCSNDICSMRLDFDLFTILGTTLTTEAGGGTCIDKFTVKVNTAQSIPTICGQNTGQHIYIDVGAASTDSATLAFTFSGTSTTRLWEIKVTQITCYSPTRAPSGCLQYNTALTGRLTTFNFIPTNDNHLANQDYSVCIREAKGYCCVQYAPCTDTNSFTIDSSIAASRTDSACSGDYIGIAASNGACQDSLSRVPVINKYCGRVFNANSGLTANGVVCDCNPPFVVHVHTDALSDLFSATIANTAASRGACLTWTQIPCSA